MEAHLLVYDVDTRLEISNGLLRKLRCEDIRPCSLTELLVLRGSQKEGVYPKARLDFDL